MPFPDNLVQECRVTVALVCRELVYEKKSTGESSLKQKELMEKTFHGTATYSSHLDEFIDGKGQFSECFVSHVMENNREGNEERGSRTSGVMLELKELFHRRSDARYCVHECGFSRDKIAKNGTGEGAKLIDARILDDRAREGIANYKHALRFANEYLHSKESPSDMKIEDLADYVLRKMYVHMKGSIKAKNIREGATEKKEEDMPSKWFFTGYWAFLLFGRLVDDENLHTTNC